MSQPARTLPIEAVDCPRGYTDADCDVLCCRCCHQEDTLGDDSLGAECLMAMAEEYAERDRIEERGRTCRPDCGYCGACS